MLSAERFPDTSHAFVRICGTLGSQAKGCTERKSHYNWSVSNVQGQQTLKGWAVNKFGLPFVSNPGRYNAIKL